MIRSFGSRCRSAPRALAPRSALSAQVLSQALRLHEALLRFKSVSRNKATTKLRLQKRTAALKCAMKEFSNSLVSSRTGRFPGSFPAISCGIRQRRLRGTLSLCFNRNFGFQSQSQQASQIAGRRQEAMDGNFPQFPRSRQGSIHASLNYSRMDLSQNRAPPSRLISSCSPLQL